MSQGASSPSLRDVAHRAGVSAMTVSRALRGLPKVSENLRHDIVQLAREMGYTPDPRISQLMAHLRQGRAAGTSVNLAWLTPYTTEDGSPARKYRTRILQGARVRARQLGYGLDVISFHKDRLSPQRCRDILDARGIQGVIISPLGTEDRVLQVNLDGLAVTAIGFSLEEPHCPRVGENFFEDTLLVLQRLQSRGCGRVGVVLEMDPGQHMVEHVVGAWAGWCVKNQKPLLPPLVGIPLKDSDLKKWFKQEKPDGLVTNIHPPSWFPRRLKCYRIGLISDASQTPGVLPDLEGMGATAVDMVASQILSFQKEKLTTRKSMLLSGRLAESTSGD